MRAKQILGTEEKSDGRPEKAVTIFHNRGNMAREMLKQYLAMNPHAYGVQEDG